MEVIKKYLLHKPLLTKGSAVFILALLFLGALVPLEFVDAGIFDFLVDVAAGTFTALPAMMFTFALQLILTLTSMLVFVAGEMFEGIINMPILFTRCPGADLCFLDIAWNLMRDTVNMLLIIILVVIAFATMLKREEFGIRKALLPLIAVAILVNFSKVIVGVVVDVSTLIMGVFLTEITGLGALTDSLKLQGNIIMGQLDISFFKISDQVVAIFKTLTLIVFQVGYAFIFILYPIIFLVRYVALWLLAIFSPIALAAFIFPATRKKIFNPWRDQLISWSFIGVTASFFLWLGKLFSNSVETYAKGVTFSGSTPMGDFLLEIFPYIFLLIFLYVTFMLALKTNAMGANMIISQASKWGAAAGKATSKFAGRMAQRGAMVGARGAVAGARTAGQRWIRPGLQKIAPKIPIVKQWQPGYAVKKYDSANPTNRQKLLRRTGLLGSRDRRDRLITGDTAWGSLTPDQQDKFVKEMRSKTAKNAAKILGAGAKSAKRIASTPFAALTPEEQKALWSVVTLERIRKAKTKDFDTAVKALEEKGLNDPKSLKRTLDRETNPSKRLAAQFLLSRDHPAEFEKLIPDENERKRIIGESKKVGKENEVLGSLGADAVRDMYKDPIKQAEKMRKAMAAANKKIGEAYKDMETLGETALRNIMDSTASFQDRLAAARRLADNKQLSEQDFAAIKNTAKNFEQYQHIAKRYLHFADTQEITDVVKKMSPQDYPKINSELFDDANRVKFEEFYKTAASEGFLKMWANDEIRQKIQNTYTDAAKSAFLKTGNSGVHSAMDRRRFSPLGDPNWPK